MRILRRTLFGNPILRTPARRLEKAEITDVSTQELIQDMRHTLKVRKYGVGLAAPQVGKGIALSVIGIKPTPNRPENPSVDMVLINPEVVETYGDAVPKWEGCISIGTGASAPYAQAMRYEKIRARYTDEQGKDHEKDVEGLLAHVMQHEIDHLNGILCVDRIADIGTLITMSEYRKRVLPVIRTARQSSAGKQP